ncbi:P-type conjugative transfer protein VirB9 (plasmid) [Mesorhizobium sp. 131-2-5]|uniref:P-type conjugative transfer protein VirB9 n=1 Tax=Mesorhizobium sp. 131-2-5 TaxID=2744519 RepID=UPI0018EE1584|nr:P-type conjugative transfer protein VirB9 [Mesorhizobium sp. 131-2-5]BCH04988.1 P-type conjugative transfer protein VirB9 [Mesorhizobium sp. 131-2-5]
MNRRIAHSVVVGLLFWLGGRPAFSEAVPKPGRVDSRVRDVVYNKDNVTAIDATFGTSTMIELQGDEKIETLALGDSTAWKVEPNHKGNIIFVKPIEKEALSNLNVVTDKRIYSFLLRSNTRPPALQIFVVRFRYPEDEASAQLLATARERAANPNLKDLNIANANSDYGYKGSSANKPIAVFDDGTKTWFRFEGETPAIYIVDSGRNESLVNFRTEGPYVVVDKVSPQWTLRNGSESTCIFNRRLTNVHEPNGLEPYAPQRVGMPSPATGG